MLRVLPFSSAGTKLVTKHIYALVDWIPRKTLTWKQTIQIYITRFYCQSYTVYKPKRMEHYWLRSERRLNKTILFETFVVIACTNIPVIKNLTIPFAIKYKSIKILHDILSTTDAFRRYARGLNLLGKIKISHSIKNCIMYMKKKLID